MRLRDGAEGYSSQRQSSIDFHAGFPFLVGGARLEMPKHKMTPRVDPRKRPDKPFFDIELREFWLNGILIKRLDTRATEQIIILSAFEEESWPQRIDDPLRPKVGVDESARMRDIIFNLNGHQHPTSIRFFPDGSGECIRWEFV
jgi:hypothetical protein